MKAGRRSRKLGEPHRKVLAMVERFINQNGYSPTIREIRNALGITSTSLVSHYLNRLEEKGMIKRENRVSRSIRVIHPKTDDRRVQRTVMCLPIQGRIQAGEPLPIPDSSFPVFDSETLIEVPISAIPAQDASSDLFALEVQGDSMIDALVNDGDVIILRLASEAHNGEMIAAWLTTNEETTLKYFYMENNRVRLQPANPNYKPKYIDKPDELIIQGKVVFVMRSMEKKVV